MKNTIIFINTNNYGELISATCTKNSERTEKGTIIVVFFFKLLLKARSVSFLATLKMKLFFLYTHLFTSNIFAFCAIKGGLHGTDY